jgi:hypothetical protein
MAIVWPIATHATAAELNLPFSWRWSESRDAITDKIVRMGETSTLSFRMNGVPQIGFASVLIGCASEKPLIAFDWGPKVAGKAGLAIQYRFEEHPGRELTATYVRTTRQTVSKPGEIRRFLADASKADRLYVRVLSDRYGTVEARFHVRAGAELAALLGRYCPSVAVE